MGSSGMRKTGTALLFGTALLATGCKTLPWPSIGTTTDADGEYCLSAGQGQEFDCDQPAGTATGPLRIRSLPIDDETLYARVEEVKRWLASEKIRLTDGTAAGQSPALIPPAPDAPVQPAVTASDPQETLAAALALAERADYATALELLSTYRELNPEDLSATLAQSRILLQAGDSTAAEQLLEAALSEHPLVPELYNNLAVIQAQTGRLGAAIETLQQAFATDPSFARIQRNLKQLYSASAQNALAPDLPPTRPQLEMIEQLPSPEVKTGSAPK